MVLNVVGSNPTGHPEETDPSVSFFCAWGSAPVMVQFSTPGS